MAVTRLELASSHGDQTISQVRFVVHGLDQQAGQEMLRTGMSFIEGRPLISTNMIQAYENALGSKATAPVSGTGASSDAGLIVVIAMPSDFHVGYATFTTAYVDRSLKMVLGAPLRYASARNQLAFYLDEDTESSRKRIENEAMGGFAVANHPAIKLLPRYTIGSFRSGSILRNVITQLEVSAKALESIDFEVAQASLQSLFTVREPAEAVLVPTMVRDLVAGTVESVIMTRIRILRWQGLALLGYRFREGREDVIVTKPQDAAEHRRMMDEYGRLIASSNIFEGELAWLKAYVAHQLELMRVELDGAELEAI